MAQAASTRSAVSTTRPDVARRVKSARISSAVYNAGDVEAIAVLTADDFIDHDIHVETGIPSGPEDMRQALIAIRRGFPDIQVTVEQTVAEGEWVVTRNTWRGTHKGTFNGIPPTNKRVEMTGVVLWRIVDGKIRERRGTIDSLTLLRQLGVLPS